MMPVVLGVGVGLVALVILWLIKRQRRTLVAYGRSRQVRQEVVISASMVVPGFISSIADNPRLYAPVGAVFGVVTLFVLYVIIAGLPAWVALAGLLLWLVPAYVAQVWMTIVDAIALRESLNFINLICGLLASPTVTLPGVQQKAKTLGFPEWLCYLLEVVIASRGEIVGKLPRTCSFWNAVAMAFRHPESLARVSDGLAEVLNVEQMQAGHVTTYENLMAVLEALATFVTPAAVGLGIVLVVLSLLTGLTW